MPGFKSKRAAAQANKPEQWDDEAFNDWWDSDYDGSTNPYPVDSQAYWAWAGWQAALAQPAQEPIGYVKIIGAPFGDKLQPVLTKAVPVGTQLYTAPPLPVQPEEPVFIKHHGDDEAIQNIFKGVRV